jgi:hypothetical protein
VCLTVRLDAKNFNTGGTVQCVTPILYPGTGTRVYCAWSAKTTTLESHNYEVMWNWFDWSNQSVGTPVQIQPDAGIVADNIAACNLNDGTMIVGFGTAGPRVMESTNLGVTWPVSADPTGTYGAGAGGVPVIAGLYSDGTNAYLITQLSAGGGVHLDTNLYKRTGPGAWTLVKKIFDVSTAPYYYFILQTFSGARVGVAKDANTQFIIADYATTNSGADKIKCLWTTDAWVTVNESLVKDYTGFVFARGPTVVKGSDNVCRAMWIDNSTGSEVPVFAKTTDFGQTWTVIGTPTITADTPWDNSYDRAFYTGNANGIYAGAFNIIDGTNLRHFLFKGNDTLSGWTEIVCQHLTYSRGGGTTGAGMIAGGHWFRLFNRTNGGTPYFSVDMLWEANVETIPVPPICIVQPLAQVLVGGTGTVTLCAALYSSLSGGTLSYAWTGPGGFTATTRCITVSVAGTYNLTITDSNGGPSFCQGIVVSVPAPPPPPAPTSGAVSVPHRRGDLKITASGHPSGNPTIATPGQPSG